jgi:hypothetical protein
MRNLIFILFLVVGLSSFAQEEIVVTLKNKTFSVGELPSFVTFIPQANYNDVMKEWDKYLNQDTKEKTLLMDGEVRMLNKEYEKISATPLNIYSYLKEYDGELMLVCAFQLGNQWISREMDEEIYIPTKKYVRDFAVEAYKQAVADQLKEQEKVLKKMEGQKTSLLNSTESKLFEINQFERAIITKKDQITLNKIDQSNKVIQMQAQKELVLKLANAGEDEKDEAEKILKELEKDFKKLQKQNENYHQDIDNNESYIRQSEIQLAKISSEVKFMQLDIDDQAYKVRKVQQKLDGIR